MLPHDKLQRGFANKQVTRHLRFSWSKQGSKNAEDARQLKHSDNRVGVTKFFTEFGFWKFRKWNSKQTSLKVVTEKRNLIKVLKIRKVLIQAGQHNLH